MKSSNPLFRLVSSAVAASMVLAPALAAAQPMPPPAAATVPLAAGDPPARVGRLARIVGTVSFHTADADHWDPATLNYPVTSGNAFWTEPGAEAEIEASGTRAVLNESTEFDIATLDTRTFAATEPQGEVYLRVRNLASGESTVVTTPRGVVTIREPGRYVVGAGDTEHSTSVTVIEGAADVAGVEPPLHLAANQTALITGTDNFQAQIGPTQPDAFVTALIGRERSAEHPPTRAPSGAIAPAAAPAVVAEMSGGEDLDAYGSWQASPEYGTVWYPQVASGWVPYRQGHWAYVAPWGWTWVDDAPWGFAPFHYGRWADIDGRWGWIPAAYEVESAPYPVYAPAVVSFFDPGTAFLTGAAVGAIGGAFAVGWLPLGPREVYRPWYRASHAYLRDVNIRQVQNFTTVSNVTNNVTINRFVNRAAATGVPAAAMATSRPIAAIARPIPPAQLAGTRPIVGRMPLQPTIATAGITPALAGRMHLPAPPAGVAATARPAAPGPAIGSVAGRPGAVPLRNASISGASVTGTAAPATPHAGPPGLPVLAAPGARTAPAAPGGAPGPAIVRHAPNEAVPHPEVLPGANGSNRVAAPAEPRPGEPRGAATLATPSVATPRVAGPTSPLAGPRAEPRPPAEPHPQASIAPREPAPVAVPRAVPAPMTPRVEHPPAPVAHPQAFAAPIRPPAPVRAPEQPAFHPPAAIRAAPPPQLVAPQLVAPQPQIRAAPPPQFHAAPPPQVRAAPPPQVRAAPPPQIRAAPPPVVQRAAAPAPRRPEDKHP